MDRLQTFPTREALFEAAAERMANALRRGIEARGQACAALSGGTTPEPAYALLASRLLDWPDITFALVDERFLPPDHPDSNEAMLRRALRKPLLAGAQLAPMYDPSSPGEAAARADAVYAALHLDIALLGMGADGHTASWFPGAAGLDDALDPQSTCSVVALHAPQAAGSAERLSLTLAALARANELLLVIIGAAKRAKLDEAEREGPRVAPVAALLSCCADKLNVFWTP